ncbi:MAG: iron transporter, partial [Salinibacter sp.]
MTCLRTSLLLLVFVLAAPSAAAQEKVFGEKVVDPGVKFTFIAAPKDAVRPEAQHLAEDQADIHLEVLAGWTEAASEAVGAPAGGFVPYVHMFARITNERTGQTQKVSLVPHINLSDNAHYAR